MFNKELLMGSKIKLYNIIRGSVSNVSLSYSPQVDIKAGTTVNITVNANSGYRNPWVTVSKNDGSGNVSVSGSGSNRSFVMPKSDVTITAGADRIPTYSVSGSASGGSISFSKTSGIYEGETITVYLSPNSYYVLSGLSSNPSVGFSGSGNTRTFTMPSSNVSISATFVAPSNSGSAYFSYRLRQEVSGDGDVTDIGTYTLTIPSITLGNVYTGEFTCRYAYIQQNYPRLEGVPIFLLDGYTSDYSGFTLILDTDIGTFSKKYTGDYRSEVSEYPSNLPNPKQSFSVNYTIRLP